MKGNIHKKIFKKMLTIVGIWYNMQTYDRDSDISIQLHRKRIRPLGRRILFKKGFGKEAVDEGIIDEIGGISQAIQKLHALIDENNMKQ